MKQYTVKADRLSGAWLGTPQYESEVNKAEWDKMEDTTDSHFDTFERHDETCAIRVVWVD